MHGVQLHPKQGYYSKKSNSSKMSKQWAQALHSKNGTQKSSKMS